MGMGKERDQPISSSEWREQGISLGGVNMMLTLEESFGGWSEVVGSMAGDLVDPELQGTCTQSSYMC